MDTFDFLTGQEDYKLQWTKKRIELYSSEVLIPDVLHALLRTSRALLRGTSNMFREYSR